MLVYSRKPSGSKRESGVGLLLKIKVRLVISTWELVCNRLVAEKFRFRINNISIVQCYAPMETSDTLEKDSYEQLKAIQEQLSIDNIEIMLDDLNFKLKKRSSVLQ